MYKLRDYQKEAVQNTIHYFRKKKDPALIVLPTGAGKSLVIAELARIAKGRVLVLAHVKELVEQNSLKYKSYGLKAGVYSAGLNKKEGDAKVIFGSIQSVAKAPEELLGDFSLLIIDECHRVSFEEDSQYSQVIKKLQSQNNEICILGLTATPYRLGQGWIYNTSHRGVKKTREDRFFKHCVFELPLQYMIQNHYLTPPVKVDIPVTCYDFSELVHKDRAYTTSEIEAVLKKQRRLTPMITKNIVDITENYQRQGVMIFSSTIKHAQEIMEHLPALEARMVIGDTENSERDDIIQAFKNKEFKYLVNVSVLTTGFDAPHVDVIAILRPTESVSLYQQIIGRGLRLDPEKKDCFILDYTGMTHDIYTPEIGDKKPHPQSVAVHIPCPECGFINNFWGRLDDQGHLLEHYGRTCQGGVEDPKTLEFKACGYRFRFKICPECGAENDLTARQCQICRYVFVDPDTKLKQAKLSKNAHVMKPDAVELEHCQDKRGNSFLEVRYYDLDGQYLSEAHYLNNSTSLKKFNINFLRSHMKRPELNIHIRSVEEVLGHQHHFRMPAFVIARKQGKYWRITEKIFMEEL